VLLTLSDLQNYTRELAQKIPALREEIILESPGCSVSECERAKENLPEISDNYLSCIQRLDLKGKAIGLFRLSPGTRRRQGRNLVDDLLETNTSDSNPLKSLLQRDSLTQVAAWEADPICVAGTGSAYAEGKVLLVDNFSTKPGFEVKPLADSFETLLLLAGNLDAIRDKYSGTGNSAAALQEFNTCLREFGVRNEATPSWKMISELVLGRP
jgi:hypothetical protein